MADHAQPLREQDVDADPVRQFQAWFAEAREAGARDPEAAAVATATRDGAPSARMVLVKQVDERGFLFFTNYDSHKARDLETNPRAALLFHWDVLGRQVRVEGAVQRVSRDETEAYARSRARGSQVSALASVQSRPVESRQVLEDRVAEIAAEYEGRELPVPEGWGGYRVNPEIIEFWQHRADRLHDRLRYCLTASGGWKLERLQP